MNNFLRLIVLIFWAISILLIVYFNWWYLSAVILFIHFIETFFVGLKAGKIDNRSILYATMMCMIFGIIWWYPIIKKQEVSR